MYYHYFDLYHAHLTFQGYQFLKKIFEILFFDEPIQLSSFCLRGCKRNFKVVIQQKDLSVVYNINVLDGT